MGIGLLAAATAAMPAASASFVTALCDVDVAEEGLAAVSGNLRAAGSIVGGPGGPADTLAGVIDDEAKVQSGVKRSACTTADQGIFTACSAFPTACSHQGGHDVINWGGAGVLYGTGPADGFGCFGMWLESNGQSGWQDTDRLLGRVCVDNNGDGIADGNFHETCAASLYYFGPQDQSNAGITCGFTSSNDPSGALPGADDPVAFVTGNQPVPSFAVDEEGAAVGLRCLDGRGWCSVALGVEGHPLG